MASGVVQTSTCSVECGDGHFMRMVLSGNWKCGKPPSMCDCTSKLKTAAAGGTVEVVAEPDDWDSRLAAFLFTVKRFAEKRNLTIKFAKLPDGLRQLLDLAAEGKVEHHEVAAIGQAGFFPLRAMADWMRFIGDLVKGISRGCCRRKVPHGTRFCRLLRQSGLESLPIVITVSFLIGIILGFIGAVQLKRFGAAIFVADLVGIAMVREMAPLMTAVVLAGRVGAAFSATIASMRTRGEIDALNTFGISTIDFLVVPRVLAMVAMTPPLCVFSAFIGIGGGMAVAMPMVRIGSSQYIHETIASISFMVFCFGVVKSAIFALLIASIACRSGMTCDRTAEGVGRATTRAVVHAITAIIAADAICDAIAMRLHI